MIKLREYSNNKYLLANALEAKTTNLPEGEGDRIYHSWLYDLFTRKYTPSYGNRFQLVTVGEIIIPLQTHVH